MSGAGDVLENPVTGERPVVGVGTEDSGGELLIADLYVRPGGAVTGEHYHPTIEEWFVVMSGRVGYRLDGRRASRSRGGGTTSRPARCTTGGTPGRTRRTSYSR